MSWRRHPVKHLAEVSVSNVDKKSAAGEVPVRLVNYTDVYYGDRLVPSRNLMQATASPRQIEIFRLRPGDVVITKDSETAEDIGVPAYVQASAEDMVLGYHLALLRPRQKSVDGRYLYWAMCSDDARGQLSTGATGVTRFALRTDVIRSATISAPAAAEQRAIADFLDTETARIDALTTKKRRLTELLDERSAGAVEVAVRAMVAEDGEVPLKRLVAEVTVGIVVTPSEWYAPEGVVALRGLNIRPGRIDAADVVHLTQEGHRLHRKSALRQGDVVVVRTGQAGAAAVVPSHLDGANCVDLLIVRQGEMDSEFLTFVLNSDWTQKHVERNSVGSIQSHFNVGALRELPVPNSSLDRQHQTAQQLRLDTTRLSETRHRLSRQIDLLHKRRQALITAAVTGELELPGVAA